MKYWRRKKKGGNLRGNPKKTRKGKERKVRADPQENWVFVFFRFWGLYLFYTPEGKSARSFTFTSRIEGNYLLIIII